MTLTHSPRRTAGTRSMASPTMRPHSIEERQHGGQVGQLAHEVHLESRNTGRPHSLWIRCNSKPASAPRAVAVAIALSR